MLCEILAIKGTSKNKGFFQIHFLNVFLKSMLSN